MAGGGGHTGGKPEADGDAVALALEMRASAKFKMQEIVAATGLSRATIYRRIADARDGESAVGVEYEENATREPPASGGMVSAKDTRRVCALPDDEHYSKRLADVRGFQRRDVYAEYVAACEAAMGRSEPPRMPCIPLVSLALFCVMAVPSIVARARSARIAPAARNAPGAVTAWRASRSLPARAIRARGQ